MERSSKDVSIDNLLLDQDDSSVHDGSQKTIPQKGRSLEEKLDFFTEFAQISQRLRVSENKDTQTVGRHTSSDRDSLHIAKQIINLNWLAQVLLVCFPEGLLPLLDQIPIIFLSQFLNQMKPAATLDCSGKGLCHNLQTSQVRILNKKSTLRTRILQLILTHLKPLNMVRFGSQRSGVYGSFVILGRDQVKKSAQLSMALPPAQPLVYLLKYMEFSALGSNDDENEPHHPPTSKGEF